MSSDYEPGIITKYSQNVRIVFRTAYETDVKQNPIGKYRSDALLTVFE